MILLEMYEIGMNNEWILVEVDERLFEMFFVSIKGLWSVLRWCK